MIFILYIPHASKQLYSFMHMQLYNRTRIRMFTITMFFTIFDTNERIFMQTNGRFKTHTRSEISKTKNGNITLYKFHYPLYAHKTYWFIQSWIIYILSLILIQLELIPLFPLQHDIQLVYAHTTTYVQNMSSPKERQMGNYFKMI